MGRLARVDHLLLLLQAAPQLVTQVAGGQALVNLLFLALQKHYMQGLLMGSGK